MSILTDAMRAAMEEPLGQKNYRDGAPVSSTGTTLLPKGDTVVLNVQILDSRQVALMDWLDEIAAWQARKPPLPFIWQLPRRGTLWILQAHVRALYSLAAVLYSWAVASDNWITTFRQTFRACNRSPGNEVAE